MCRFLADHCGGDEDRARELAATILAQLGRDKSAPAAEEPAMSRLAAPVIMAQVGIKTRAAPEAKPDCLLTLFALQSVKEEEARVNEAARLLLAKDTVSELRLLPTPADFLLRSTSTKPWSRSRWTMNHRQPTPMTPRSRRVAGRRKPGLVRALGFLSMAFTLVLFAEREEAGGAGADGGAGAQRAAGAADARTCGHP